MAPPDYLEKTGRLRALLSHLARPADDWAYQGHERRTSVLTTLMVLLLCLLGAIAVLTFAAMEISATPWISLTLAGLFIAACGIVVILMIQVRQHLLQPLSQLYAWALRMCDGDFTARIPAAQQGRFAKLSFHINRLSEALDRLANEMDDLVWEQTARLHQKNRSIELLYEVAAAISGSDVLVEILENAARRLMILFDAQGVEVYLIRSSGAAEMIRTLGTTRDVVAGDSQTTGYPAMPAALEKTRVLGQADQFPTILVPLRYQEQTLGQIRLFVAQASFDDDDDTLTLLDNVGKHLGMAITKFKLDEEARQVVLMRERSSLAYELHDSLAQTIAAVRFQISNLTQTLEGGDVALARRELHRIHGSLGEVNTEVRQLIANFRAPMSNDGLVASIKNMVTQFENETGIHAYFQPRCETLRLPSAAEMQILGITREALANIRKHSDANSVRLLLQGGEDGGYRLLIEDDGVGISEPIVNGKPGEHIGLSIMRERAERLGGELRIESEPGDGTRVELDFDVAVLSTVIGVEHASRDH